MDDHALYGPKAEWCIGTQNETHYWDDHKENGDVF
jgi:hypothetical protein